MNPLLRANRTAFIQNQLAMFAGTKREQGDRFFVLCPFHAERTPSGKIDRNSGYFWCFGCGAQAKWDEVAPKLGMEPFKSGPPKDEQALDLFMGKASQALTSDVRYEKGRFKFWPLPKNKKWRTIPTNTLIKLGGRLCVKWSDDYQRWGSTKYIYLPVNINKEKEGYFLARLTKHPDYPSYMQAKAVGDSHWVKTHGLWPFNMCIKLMRSLDSRTVVLVEGQRDALRLLLHGIPAVCIFGTQSWSDSKAKLLEIAGVKTVVMFMDGDCAGRDATINITPRAKKLLSVRVLKLWKMKGSPWLKFRHYAEPSKVAKKRGVELWDPGNVPVRILDKIKAKYFTT
jgi:hypothetical protein